MFFEVGQTFLSVGRSWQTGVCAQSELPKGAAPVSRADPAPEEESDVKLNPNIEMPTLGGRQFWADVECFREWRIQQNVVSKHFRLLDGSDARQAWGTREQCQ